jgi:hypothetical protein
MKRPTKRPTRRPTTRRPTVRKPVGWAGSWTTTQPTRRPTKKPWSWWGGRWFVDCKCVFYSMFRSSRSQWRCEDGSRSQVSIEPETGIRPKEERVVGYHRKPVLSLTN